MSGYRFQWGILLHQLAKFIRAFPQDFRRGPNYHKFVAEAFLQAPIDRGARIFKYVRVYKYQILHALE